MKPILPTLRENNRYLVYKVNCDVKIALEQVKEAINKACLKLMGEIAMAKANVYVMKDFKNNKGIVKVNNKYLNELHASLLFVDNINGRKANVESVGVSGTIKKAREKFM